MGAYLEGLQLGGVVVQLGGQQALPALGVFLVGQPAGPQLHVQDPVPGQDGPETRDQLTPS